MVIVLNASEVGSPDLGVYVCKADNKLGKQEAAVFLHGDFYDKMMIKIWWYGHLIIWQQAGKQEAAVSLHGDHFVMINIWST